MLARDRVEKGRHISRRFQVMNLFGGRYISHKLPVSGRQSAMANPNHLV